MGDGRGDTLIGITSLNLESAWSSRLRAKKRVSSGLIGVVESAKTHSRSSGTSVRGSRGRWHVIQTSIVLRGHKVMLSNQLLDSVMR